MKLKNILALLMSLSLIVAFSCDSQKKTQNVINSSKITFIIGNVKVKIKADSPWIKARSSMKLGQGSEIKTGKKSKCNLVIGKDSFVSVTEKSHMILEKLYKDVTGLEKNTLSLKFGQSVINPKKLLKGDSFKIKTPTAVAAVRGTKFVVKTDPNHKMKVSVIDGKVELKRRIPVLEKVDSKVVDKSDALTTLKKKVAEETIVIKPNQSAAIDNKKVAAENKVIEKVIVKHVKKIEKEIKADEKKEKLADKKENKNVLKDDTKKTLSKITLNKVSEKKDKEINDTLTNIFAKKKVKKEKVIVLEKKVDKADVQAVKELDKAIKEVKKQQKQEKEVVTELHIKSINAKTAIYVNDRLIGSKKGYLRPIPGADLTIKAVTVGFETFTQTIKLSKGESKIVNVSLVENASITIKTPRGSKIYINNKYAGINTTSYSTQSGKKFLVEIVTPGYEKYSSELTLSKKERRVFSPKMVRVSELQVVSTQRGSKIYINNKYAGNQRAVIQPGYGKDVTIEVKAPGHEPFKKTISLKRGEVKTVYATLSNYPKLTIVAPVRYSRIYVNNRYVGRNQVVVQNKPGKEVTVDVYAPGFHKYKKNITVQAGKDFRLNVELVRKRALTRVKWNSRIGSAVSSKPLFYGNKIIVTTTDGSLVAMNRNGRALWRVNLKRSILSTPVISRGIIYVVPNSGDFYAINSRNGAVIWKKKLIGSLLYGSKPFVMGKKLYLATSLGMVYSFNTNGKILWKKDIENGVYSSIAYLNGTLFIPAEDHRIYSLRASDGKVKWSFQADSRMVSSSPFIKGNTLYIGSYKGTLFAIDVYKGSLKWKYSTGKSIFSSPVVYNNKVFFGSNNGSFYALSARNGAVIWTYKTGTRIITKPAISRNRVFITTGTRMIALSQYNGRVAWKHEFNERIKTSPTFANNSIIIGLASGRVVSIRDSVKDIYK